MAKHRKAKAANRAVSPASRAQNRHPLFWRFAPALVLFVVALAAYWTPLTSNNATILWDAADYFQVVQDYLSQEIHAGRLPFWTPYVWAGYPFLADPQIGAWYPLNWPFFAFGVPPRAIELELFLHALIACFGAALLAYRLLQDRPAAILAGLVYGLSGFFSGHSSHVAMVQAAAWLPFMLLWFECACERRPVFFGALAALTAGLIILPGHFQTALYSFFALALYAGARTIQRPGAWRRVMPLAAAVPIGGALLSAIQAAPGLELTAYSIRSGLAAVRRTEGFLSAGSLLTLLDPDHYGVLSHKYTGPDDVTQYYFYAGILLLPLAAFGLRNKTSRVIGLLLFAIPVWYAAGNSAGLYAVLARAPGFASVRAPINIWFVPAIGLALLAAAGMSLLRRKWPARWLAAALLVFFSADLWYANFARNPMAYARESYEQTYGRGEALFRVVTQDLPPLSRFDAPPVGSFGPMAHPISSRVETTYGYGALILRSYSDYAAAMQSNPKLRNGLGVARFLDAAQGRIVANPGALPRATFPTKLIAVANLDDSRHKLASLDPAEASLVPAAVAGLKRDASAIAEVTEASAGKYRIRYRTATDAVLRWSMASFPGWSARVDGRKLEVFTVDHALTGIRVPAGSHEVVLEYRSTYFVAGAAVTAVAFGLCIAALVWSRPRRANVSP